MIIGRRTLALAFGMLVAGFLGAAYAQTPDRVFELRTYTAQPGKFDAMKARFKDHVVPLFEKHGMTVIGFWTAADAPTSENTLTYVLAFPNRDAAKASWAAFRADPERVKVWTDTEKDGPINLKVDSMYLNPVAFSRIK